MSSCSNRGNAFVLTLILMLCLICACSRPTPDNSAVAADSQKLPFDRQSRGTGITPSRSLIPITTKLAEGTPIPVRLQTALSSATAHAGDTFAATIDEPVVIDGQLLIAGGAIVKGSVLEAKAATRSSRHSAANSVEPGYLRIVLVSLNVGDRPVLVETSSIFAKGGLRDERSAPNVGGANGESLNSERDSSKDRNVVFEVGRRLDFRLAQAVDLQ